MTSPPDAQPRKQLVRNWLIGVVAAVLLVFLFREAQTVFLPLFAAFFLAVLLQPMERRFRDRLPDKIDWLALVPPILTMLLVLAVFALAGWGIYELSRGQIADHRQELTSAWERVRGWGESVGLNFGGSGGGGALPGGFGRSLLTDGLAVAAGLTIVFFLVVLMLVEDPRWPGKLSSALGDERAGKVISTTRDVASKVRTYLLVRLFLSVISGLSAGLWLWAMGVPLAWAWAGLTVVLNFIPNLGSVLSVIPPTLAALVAGGFGHALVVFAGLVAIEQVIGNYIDPRLQGSRLRLSPVFVLVGVVFWTWVWGPAGALVAVPMLATFVVAAEHVPALHPLATLLSLDARGQRRDG